jgi:hypothetical protein
MASSEFTVSTHAYALLSQFDSDLKVEVKQSWIEEADLGLFAAADFKEGNVICCYVGKRLTTVEALRIEDKSYLMRLGNQAYIDAKDSMHCLARYAYNLLLIHTYTKLISLNSQVHQRLSKSCWVQRYFYQVAG